MRPFAHPVACCWMFLRVVGQSLKPVKLFSQQLPTFLLFRDRHSVAQQCWIRLHSSSNILGATHAHYAGITKTYGLYSSHDALPVPNKLGVVASVCTPLPTRTQHTPNIVGATMLGVVASFCTQLPTGTQHILNIVGATMLIVVAPVCTQPNLVWTILFNCS